MEEDIDKLIRDSNFKINCKITWKKSYDDWFIYKVRPSFEHEFTKYLSLLTQIIELTDFIHSDQKKIGNTKENSICFG
jgi:hypothetical protein